MATHFYARVSSKDQDPKSQIEAARARGIPAAKIHVETASGVRHDRPILTALLAELKAGDTLVTFRLDRLGRSLSHLVKTLEDLEVRKIGFETLDGVSTKGATRGVERSCRKRSLSPRLSVAFEGGRAIPGRLFS
jgi:DNA invertase Pin-like site-specific DNA recombinase